MDSIELVAGVQWSIVQLIDRIRPELDRGTISLDTDPSRAMYILDNLAVLAGLAEVLPSLAMDYDMASLPKPIRLEPSERTVVIEALQFALKTLEEDMEKPSLPDFGDDFGDLKDVISQIERSI